jgi:glucose-1-phosphate cytidylyltransferase
MHLSRINGGFMVANETIFTKLSPISECSLETEVFNTLINEEQISLWKHDGFWQNVDTERDIDFLQRSYEINKRPWLGIN